MDHNVESMIDRSQPLSKAVFEKSFTEVKGFLNLKSERAYVAKDVDVFLSGVGRELERFEEQAGKLYRFYEKYKSSAQAVVRSGTDVTPSAISTTEETPIESERTASFAEREAKKNFAKVQEHMTELLLTAQEKAENIILESEMEKDNVINKARARAKEIIDSAMESAAEIDRKAQEKIQELNSIKESMEQRSNEITNDIIRKAEEMDKMVESLASTSNNLKQIVNKRESVKTA